MNNTSTRLNFFSTIQNLIKKNIKVIIFSALVIIIVTAGLQIYFLIKSNKILDLSIAYNNSKYSDSQIDFIKGIAHAFNLQFQTDEKQKLITIEPCNDFYKDFFIGFFFCY